MKALRELRKFILIKCAEGNQGEIRAYVTENLDTIAHSFQVSVETLMGALEATSDDNALAARLLETALRGETMLRKAREVTRLIEAQQSADALGAAVEWKGDVAHVDMISLLASVLTRRQDALVFQGDDFTVAISQAALLDLAKIARVRADLTGFVDAQGLHLRWKSGALNLYAQKPEPHARKVMRVIVNLPARVAVAAA
jgi:hypothetical protein